METAPTSLSQFFENIFTTLFSWGIFGTFSDFVSGILEIPLVRTAFDFIGSLPGIKQLLDVHNFMYQNEAFEFYRIMLWGVVTITFAYVFGYYFVWGMAWFRSKATERSRYEEGRRSFWVEIDPEVRRDKPRNVLFYLLTPLIVVIYRTLQAYRAFAMLTNIVLSVYIFINNRFITAFPRDFISRTAIDSSQLETRYTQRDVIDAMRKDAKQQIRSKTSSQTRLVKTLRQQLRDEQAKVQEYEHIIRVAKAQNVPMKKVLQNLSRTVGGI